MRTGCNVSGKLLDEQGNPLPYANVVMLAWPDLAFVAGTVSDDNGAFMSTGIRTKAVILFLIPH